jgi:hypothetical protein
MFSWFKKKSKRQILEAKYKTLKEEAYRLSHTDRKASSLKDGEAEEVMKELELLQE